MEREAKQRRKCERLIDLINHLPAHAQLTTTKDFEQMTGQVCEHIGILQARRLVIDVGYQNTEAKLEDDNHIISIYAGGAWAPWPAFFVSHADSQEGSH